MHDCFIVRSFELNCWLFLKQVSSYGTDQLNYYFESCFIVWNKSAWFNILSHPSNCITNQSEHYYFWRKLLCCCDRITISYCMLSYWIKLSPIIDTQYRVSMTILKQVSSYWSIKSFSLLYSLIVLTFIRQTNHC